MNDFVKPTTLLLLSVCIPLVTYAQNPAWANSLLNGTTTVLVRVVIFLVGLALLLFIIGLVMFIKQSGDEKAVTEGKRNMIVGVIAIFVIVGVWGFVAVLQNFFGVTGSTNPTPPSAGQIP